MALKLYTCTQRFSDTLYLGIMSLASWSSEEECLFSAWFSCSGWECVCPFQRGRAGCYSIESLTRPLLCRFVILHAEDRMCNLILTHDLYWIVCLKLFLWQFHGTVNPFSLLVVIFHKSIGFFWTLLLWLCVFSNCCLLLCYMHGWQCVASYYRATNICGLLTCNWLPRGNLSTVWGKYMQSWGLL